MRRVSLVSRKTATDGRRPQGRRAISSRRAGWLPPSPRALPKTGELTWPSFESPAGHSPVILAFRTRAPTCLLHPGTPQRQRPRLRRHGLAPYTISTKAFCRTRTTVRATFHRYVHRRQSRPAGVTSIPAMNTTGSCPKPISTVKPIWKEGEDRRRPTSRSACACSMRPITRRSRRRDRPVSRRSTAVAVLYD